jgi:hypothetical protein
VIEAECKISVPLLLQLGLLQGRPAVGPRTTQNSRPTGSSLRSSSHGSSWVHAHRSIPTSRRLSPLPWRTSREPRSGSRSVSFSASASLIRRPARHNTTTIPRNRTPSGLSPATCITATISSTVGGSAGYRNPCCGAGAPNGSWTWWPANGAGRHSPTAAWVPRCPPVDGNMYPLIVSRIRTPEKITTQALLPSRGAEGRPGRTQLSTKGNRAVTAPGRPRCRGDAIATKTVIGRSLFANAIASRSSPGESYPLVACFCPGVKSGRGQRRWVGQTLCLGRRLAGGRCSDQHVVPGNQRLGPRDDWANRVTGLVIPSSDRWGSSDASTITVFVVVSRRRVWDRGSVLNSTRPPPPNWRPPPVVLPPVISTGCRVQADRPNRPVVLI